MRRHQERPIFSNPFVDQEEVDDAPYSPLEETDSTAARSQSSRTGRSRMDRHRRPL